jgi:hypothetical protein
MPIIIPTPDELAAMPWQARLRARKQITAALRLYGEPTRTRRSRVSPANVEFGARVREIARRMEAGA